MNTLSDRAMLARVIVHSWSATRSSSEATQHIERNFQVRFGHAKASKVLMKADCLDNYQRAASMMRAVHNRFTLPWLDDGRRVLPSTLYFDYMEAISNPKGEIQNAIRRIEREYPQELEYAAAKLGKLYNAADYPAPESIGSKFGVEIEFLPFPSSSDFRIDLPEIALEEVKQSVENQMKKSFETAEQSLFKRLHEEISKVRERLGDPKNIFRDTLMHNLRDLLDLMPKLNITGNQEISTFVTDARTMLLHDPALLRRDADTRARVAADALVLLGRIEQEGVVTAKAA